MKILLMAIGWAIGLGLSTFYFSISSMGFKIDPADRMVQLTTYGLTTGIIGGLTVGLVMLWSQPEIKWQRALLFILIWSLSLVVGGRIGWHIIQPDFTSQAMRFGTIIGMTVGGSLGGFFTAVTLKEVGLLISWADILLVALGWTIAILSGFIFTGVSMQWNFIPMGLVTMPPIGGLLTGAIGSSIMFWKIR